MKRTVSLLYVLCLVAALATHQSQKFVTYGAAASAPPQSGASVKTVPLYRLYKIAYDTNFGTSQWIPGFHFYTADAHERDLVAKYHRYKSDGVAAYVLPKKAHGTVPLYRLRAEAQTYTKKPVSTKHFYTTVKAKAVEAINAGWKDEGVVGFVAPPDRGLPGTIPLYSLYRPEPYNPHTKTHGHEHTGDGDFFYTTSEEERDHALHQEVLGGTYKSQGIAAYVWPGPAEVALHAPAAPLPDLTVRQVEAEESSVKAVVFNEGKANTGGAHLYAHLFIYDKAGKTLFSDGKWVGGMSPGQARPVKFETGGRSLVGLQYQIKLDIANQVKESNESNNVTETVRFHRTIKINPDPNAASRVPAPAATITGVEATATQALPKRTSYRLKVSNWASYDAAWFQSLKNKLPSTPCGSGPTDARMLMRYSVIRNGSAVRVGCKPLNSPQDLKVGEIHTQQPLTDTDRLVVTLEDRADGAKYPSEAFAVGWFGLGDVLTTVGCKSFLGRPSSYLCTTDKGMAACENLKQKGKPIQCTRAGKKAN